MTENAAPMVRQAFDDFNRENSRPPTMVLPGLRSDGGWGRNSRRHPCRRCKIAAAASRLVPAAGRLTGLTRRMADAAANGAVGATLTSSGSDDPLYEQAAWGALGGALWTGASRSAASAVAPRISPGRRALLEQEHPLTIGQAMGGTVERLENNAATWPVMRCSIRAAQERGMEVGLPGVDEER